MASSVCFLHHRVPVPSTSPHHGHAFHRQVPSQLKPSNLQVHVKAQKHDAEDHDQSSSFDAIVSRRSAISVLVGSAALATQLSPGSAASYDQEIIRVPIVKVAAIAGSLAKNSHNLGLLRAAQEICAREIPGMEIQIVEIGDLPLLNPDIKPYPPSVETFLSQFAAADCFLFATTEYNYAVTGAMKNAIDWASMESYVCKDKAAALMSAGYELGGGLAQYNMRQMGVRLDLHFINDPQLFVFLLQPPKKFDAEGNLIDDGIRKQIKELLLSLREFTLRLRLHRRIPLRIED